MKYNRHKIFDFFTINFGIFLANLFILGVFICMGNLTFCLFCMNIFVCFNTLKSVFEETVHKYLTRYSSLFFRSVNSTGVLHGRVFDIFCCYFGVFLGVKAKDILIVKSSKYLLVNTLKNLSFIISMVFFILAFFNLDFFVLNYNYVIHFLFFFCFLELFFLIFFLFKSFYYTYTNIFDLIQRTDVIDILSDFESVDILKKICWHTFFYAYVCIFFEIMSNIGFILFFYGINLIFPPVMLI